MVWLDDDDWNRVERSIPVACVDVLPVRFGGAGVVEVGLIRRATPHQGQRWCLVGGRVRRGESLAQSAVRELTTALDLPRPVDVTAFEGQAPLIAQYLPDAVAPGLHDPRKHAIAMTFTAEVPTVLGVRGDEATSFRWFAPEELDASVVGFGQQVLLPELVLAASERHGT
ncbi:DUF4916 domain-containing protein [Oryzobacter terrae]|uniref:DUF4916 domain-containing protein n=1 Tax=Oryzobacter terrae TaxID=1620385 RepID=UPI00366A8451